jgi:hypothetical protein
MYFKSATTLRFHSPFTLDFEKKPEIIIEKRKKATGFVFLDFKKIGKLVFKLMAAHNYFLEKMLCDFYKIR